jgi:hypothetical protein
MLAAAIRAMRLLLACAALFAPPLAARAQPSTAAPIACLTAPLPLPADLQQQQQPGRSAPGSDRAAQLHVRCDGVPAAAPARSRSRSPATPLFIVHRALLR